MVDPERTEHHADHRGETFHFCSARCRDKFVAAPEQYLKPDAKPATPEQAPPQKGRDLHLPHAPGDPPRGAGHLPDAIPTLNTACGSLTTLRPPPPSRIAAGLRAHCPWRDAPISPHELPAASLSPHGWRRCWTLAGDAWVPSEPRPPRWIWSGPAG